MLYGRGADPLFFFFLERREVERFSFPWHAGDCASSCFPFFLSGPQADLELEPCLVLASSFREVKGLASLSGAEGEAVVVLPPPSRQKRGER